jgi:hypothetical protein
MTMTETETEMATKTETTIKAGIEAQWVSIGQ